MATAITKIVFFIGCLIYLKYKYKYLFDIIKNKFNTNFKKTYFLL
jgi:hypothetical protein